MQCPHCLIEFHATKRCIHLADDPEGRWAIEILMCPKPDCKKVIFYLLHGNGNLSSSDGFEVKSNRYLVRPRGISRSPIPPQVPRNIAEDYTEACLVLTDSAKASAALSRRCLQSLLREAAKVKPTNLDNEIQQVLDSKILPSYLAESIDAVRNIGNFAAHPMKSTTSGEIIPVELGEAEWNLDVLESLFDLFYVQPDIIKQKRDALNKKLTDAKKPPMK
jgi:hypothetical protein